MNRRCSTAVDPKRKYPAKSFAGGGLVCGDGLEYRVWLVVTDGKINAK